MSGVGFVLKLKHIALGAAGLAAGIFILIYSPAIRGGVSRGLQLCAGTVIPSLFMFTAVVLFISLSGAANALGRYIERLSQFIFGLSGEQTVVMLLSFLSGYPVGAKLIDDMYLRGAADQKTANRMILYCVNAGPAFIITAVGEVTLGSRSDGIRLLATHIGASLIIAVVSNILRKRTRCCDTCTPAADGTVTKIKPRPTGEAFVESVSAAASTMLTVCAFVVLFSGISGGINAVMQEKTAAAICGLLEVTVGTAGCTRRQIVKVAFLLGFSGVSVHFQVMAAARHINLKLHRLVLGRILHGALSAGITAAAERLFPRTVAASVNPPSAAASGSPAASAALIFLCVVLLFSIGDKRYSTN